MERKSIADRENNMSRFELEEKIMACWSTDADLDVLYRNVCEKELDRDELANTLLGLVNLHRMRSQELWDLFEKMIADGDIT